MPRRRGPARTPLRVATTYAAAVSSQALWITVHEYGRHVPPISDASLARKDNWVSSADNCPRRAAAQRYHCRTLADGHGQDFRHRQTMDDMNPGNADSLDDLAACLKHVHLQAGRPSYRVLEQQTIHGGGLLPGTRFKRVRLTRSIISDALNGRKLPGKAFLLTFVDACGIDLENDHRWEEAWDRLAAQHYQAGAALPSADAEMERLIRENEELRQQFTVLQQAAAPAEGPPCRCPTRRRPVPWRSSPRPSPQRS